MLCEVLDLTHINKISECAGLIINAADPDKRAEPSEVLKSRPI